MRKINFCLSSFRVILSWKTEEWRFDPEQPLRKFVEKFKKLGFSYFNTPLSTKSWPTMEVFKEQVVKEPKGFIRIVQFVLALFALYSTSSFATHTAFTVNCEERPPVTIKYPVAYPFDFQNTEILVNRTCERTEDAIVSKFPMDFSSSPQFFVTTGVLSLLYSAGALAGYSLAYVF